MHADLQADLGIDLQPRLQMEKGSLRAWHHCMASGLQAPCQDICCKSLVTTLLIDGSFHQVSKLIVQVHYGRLEASRQVLTLLGTLASYIRMQLKMQCLPPQLEAGLPQSTGFS